MSIVHLVDARGGRGGEINARPPHFPLQIYTTLSGGTGTVIAPLEVVAISAELKKSVLIRERCRLVLGDVVTKTADYYVRLGRARQEVEVECDVSPNHGSRVCVCGGGRGSARCET